MITTERLTIAPLTYKHLLKYVFGRKGSIVTEEDEKWAIESVVDKMFDKTEEEQLYYTFWVASDKDGEWIGDISFKGKPSEFGVVEVGYFINEAKRNNGYATEMIKGFIEWAKELRKINFVCATVDFSNQQSKKALWKNGFKIINNTENQHIFINQI